MRGKKEKNSKGERQMKESQREPAKECRVARRGKGKRSFDRYRLTDNSRTITAGGIAGNPEGNLETPSVSLSKGRRKR